MKVLIGYADDKRHIEAFQNLVRLFDMVHADNMKILKALIYAKDDIQPLIEGSTKTKVGLCSYKLIILCRCNLNAIF